ncbi:MAG: DUF6152 family protein [Candidatus Rariloculaceae bacterium]
MAALLALPGSISAHHAVAGFFDPTQNVEIEGVVTDIRWRNPHTDFTVDVTDVAGNTTAWRVETGALGVLRSRGLYREFLRVGDEIKVLGNASVRRLQEIFAHNVLLTDGREVLLTIMARPHFSTQEGGELLESIYDEELTRAARENADGLFRVWSTNLDERPTSGARMLFGNYPLLPATLARREEWNPGNEALLGCTEWSMPRLMRNPGPFELVRENESILMQFEEDDNVREVHMNRDQATAPEAHSLMGFSTGIWEGETLVVETTGMQADVLDYLGTPHSDDIQITERFTPAADGSRLDYSLRITDPASFSESFEVTRYWIWRPEIVVGRYACEEDQPFAATTAN